jgi:ABC-type antimicrobial peptide transport system permease subunit
MSKLVATFLYGIKPNDPGNLVLAVFVLITVAILAAYLPALRASRVDPMRALREE